MLNIEDLIQTDNGRGMINILAADRLMTSPKVYATLLLWMMSEVFEVLPEVGDLDKPKLVFFSTKRICCLRMRRPHWWKKSSRSCA